MQRQRRRFQFGLRKLLLWTVALSVYLGILRMLQCHPVLVVVLTCWVGAVAVVRVAIGWKWAAVVSAVGGAILLGIPAYQARGDDSDLVGNLLLAAIVGGLAVLAVVHVIACTIDWADNLMRANKHEAGRRG